MKVFFFLCFLMIPGVSVAQSASPAFGFQYDLSPTVWVNGRNLRNPWVGGLNATQYATVRLNDDTRDDTRVDASHHDSDILSMQLRALDELESDPKRAEKIVRRLLASAVNPSDRHRWRYRLVQMLLAANRDKDAESLVAELSSDTDKLSRWVLRSLLDRDAVNPSEADAVVADAMTCEHLRIKGIVL